MRPKLAALLALALVISIVAPAVAKAAPPAAAGEQPLKVYYAGPDGELRQSLLLARCALVDDPAAAQVIVLNDAIPEPAVLAGLVRAGTGLLLIPGPHVNGQELAALLGQPIGLEAAGDAQSIDRAEMAQDPLVSEIIWNSAPQVRERAHLDGTPFSPLVDSYAGHELILGQARLGRGTAFVFTPYLSNGANPQIQQWAYFNYLIYHLAARAGGAVPLAFADYPGSPVPHGDERLALFGLLGAMLLTSFVAFGLVRAYSRRHPEALNALVVNRQEYATREAGTDWEEIGFHRPLGGFLLALALGLVLFVPLIIYQNLILPVYILPSAQALGIWGRVTQFFNVAWLFFDMGTSAAFVKFLAEYRVHDPRRGIQYGQLYIWWQALSGAVQVALVVALSSTVIPRSAYALYSWSIIIHTFIQIPGFLEVMRYALTGFQRFDYAQVLDLSLALVFPMITQPLIVTVMYKWGQTHPVFGAAMGGLLGLGLAAYAAEVLVFVVGLWLYRRLGLNVRVLFLAHFDWEVIRNSFRFGVFEMLGSMAWGLGQAAEIWITQARLINYAEIWGNWTLAQNFIFAFNALATLYNNLMPSMSEAISHGRQVLSQYYSAQAYKYGGLISAFIGAVLLAVADRFILGASGPEFVRAAAYAIPLIIWGAVQYPSWVGDNVQRAANKPYLMTIMIGAEQSIRVVLAWLLLARLQVNALIVAYFVGLLTKGIVSYIVNDRVCFRQRFYFWQSLAAPLLAGAAHYAVLRWLTGLLWQGDQVSSVLIFFVGILPSFPLFAFFYALFGGWDDATLAELRRGAELAGFMRPLAMIFWSASALGARLSPLHNRFPIRIRGEAMREALALTGEKVSLAES
jgi:O-antigen/teichoic acid export membrane protein